MSRLKQLTKDSVIYGVGGVVAKGVSFFLLPIYTRIFSVGDYGTIEMMLVIVNFLAAFLVLGMDSAQSFYFYEQKQNGLHKQKIVVSAILQWRLLWGLGMILLSTCLAPLINVFFFDASLSLNYFFVAFVGALFSTLLTQSVEVFRLLYRPWSYIGITITNTLLSAGLILLFVLVFNQGLYGYFLGTMIASAVISLFGWFLVRDYVDFSRLHKEWWSRLLKFGVPLLPASFAMYAMAMSDRWFVKYYLGAEALGLYAVGAKFAMIMALAFETFRKAWWPMAMDSMHSDDGPETFRMIARLFMGVGVAGVVYLAFLSPWLVKWMVNHQFHNAYLIVGVLAWQSLFYGFFLISAAGIWKAEKTQVNAILMTLTGGLNILLNYLWVPEYGSVGAASATVVSYFCWNTITLIVSEHYWKIGFPVGWLFTQISLGATVTVFMNFAERYNPASIVVVHLSVLVLLISALDYDNWKKISTVVTKSVRARCASS